MRRSTDAMTNRMKGGVVAVFAGATNVRDRHYRRGGQNGNFLIVFFDLQLTERVPFLHNLRWTSLPVSGGAFLYG